jgi:hypothetical protein
LVENNATWNCVQHYHVSGGDAITNLTVARNRAIDPIVSPANDYYGLVVTDVDGLMVEENTFNLLSRGISLTDATNAVVTLNKLVATVDATPITLAGTNTGPGGGALINVGNIVDNTSIGGGTETLPVTIIDAKGDLIAGTAADTAARLAAGADGTALIADSTQTTGLRWGAPTASATLASPSTLSGATTQLIFNETDGGADEKNYDIVTSGSTWLFRANNDALNSADNLIRFYSRSGITVGVMEMLGGALVVTRSTGAAVTGTLSASGAITGSTTIGATGAITSAVDTNTQSIFGRTAIGYGSGAGSDNAFLSHYDQRNSGTGYGWLQTAAGDSYFNGVASCNFRISDATRWSLGDTYMVADTALRIRQQSNTRYYLDLLTSSASTLINAFDSTGGVYIPLDLQGNTISLKPDGTTRLAATSTGVAVTGNLSVSGNFGTWTLFTYATDWSDYGGSDSPGRYRKVGDIVYVEGIVKRAVTGTLTSITTLPSGFHPAKVKHFSVDTSSATTSGRVEINASGVITLLEPTFASPGTIGYVTLDGIFFSTT